MLEKRCLGPDVDPARIHPGAEIAGASYLTGPKTSLGAGAVVRDARLHNVAVAPGATVIDSILAAEGHPHRHLCDAAGRVVVTGAELPTVAASAEIRGSTLINTSVGERTRVLDTWAKDVRFGPDNRILNAKLIITNTGRGVTVAGPTEVSEAFLGDRAAIDRRGYYEGVFSNAFRRVRYDEASRRLRVIGMIELPHLSRYGTNTINSTNSGKLLPQPGGVLKGFGPHRGLWTDALLSHEQIELGPCCWVAPWTKVVGQSPEPHADDEALVNDRLMTYLMPFAIAGVAGESTNGLVMPGELSVGYGPKKRRGAWVFTYAPDLVIRMVARLHEALDPAQKAVADTIVPEAIETALALTRALAAEHETDLSVPPSRQRRGWPLWIAETHALLRAHLEAGLWQFKSGEPAGWKRLENRWRHPAFDRILALAPDALEAQVSEEEIFAFDDPVPPVRMALPFGVKTGSGGAARIDPSARIAPGAHVGPGSIIGPECVIEPGAAVWNSSLSHTTVKAGGRVERSLLEASTVGERTVVRSSQMKNARLGRDSTADGAAMTDSDLADRATVSAFARVEKVRTTQATILGGTFRRAEIDVALMSMHMAGACRHLKAVPTAVYLNGSRVEVPAIPMIGGGALIRGSEERPVVIECAFIGSNAILEPGSYVGFGSFVLGTLGPEAGLLPFTLATGEAGLHQIGGVLSSLSSTVITHFVNWTFQALGPDAAPAVAELVRQSIGAGIRAIEGETRRRAAGAPFGPASPPGPYKSLPDYTDAQLLAGLATYRKVLEQGAWEIRFNGTELVFASEKGRWIERQGNAFWESA
ncbi:MAG: hypothetical protein V1918_09940 [Planctomycetota bacterium]